MNSTMPITPTTAVSTIHSHHHERGSGSGSGGGGGGGGGSGSGSGSTGWSSDPQRMQFTALIGLSSPHVGQTSVPMSIRPPAPGSRRSVASLATPPVTSGSAVGAQNNG